MSAQILLTEDNVANMELICYLDPAFSPTAINPREGGLRLELATAEKPDVIVRDVQFSRVNCAGAPSALKSKAAV